MNAPKRIARGTYTDDEKRSDAIRDRLNERGLWPYVKIACSEHHVTPDEIFGSSRMRSHVAARHAFWNALHDVGGMSWPQVAALLGKSHDSIVHASEAKARTKTLRAETRIANLIADFVTREGRPDLGKQIRAGAWRPVARAQATQGEPRKVETGKASPA